MDTLDTHHAYLLAKDGEPVGLLQTYEPEAGTGSASATRWNPVTSASTC